MTLPHFNPRCIRTFSAALLFALAASAQAGVTFNDWNYALDSTTDGAGGSDYELLGIAYKQVGSQLIFAISSNMPITGNYEKDAANKYISPGDLFLNFSDHNLDSAADFRDSDVFAVRFSQTNDSLGNTYSHYHYSNTTLGLFSNITPVAKSGVNLGYSTLQAYINAGYGRSTKAMGDLQSSTGDVTAYLGNGAMYTNISAGTLVSALSLMSSSQLITDGVDFAHFGNKYAGSEIYGFAIDASILPNANFTAHMFEECSNDGIAITGHVSNTSNVPEPASIALFALGGLLIAKKRKKA